MNRSSGDMGTADVSGIMNVYDDQMWLIRELLNAYRLTGDEKFLTEAEYLTGYVLDGWDSTLDDNGSNTAESPGPRILDEALVQQRPDRQSARLAA